MRAVGCIALAALLAACGGAATSAPSVAPESATESEPTPDLLRDPQRLLAGPIVAAERGLPYRKQQPLQTGQVERPPLCGRSAASPPRFDAAAFEVVIH